MGVGPTAALMQLNAEGEAELIGPNNPLYIEGGGGGGGDVSSVNGQTGIVVLDAEDVGAATEQDITDAVSGLASDADVQASKLVTTRTVTGATTLTLADAGNALHVNSSSSASVTIPPNSSVPYPNGTVIEIVQAGTGAVTVAQGSGVTLRPGNSQALRAQWSSCTIRKFGTDSWLLSGDIA